MALIPLFVVVYYLPYPHAPMIAAIIFAGAGVTDWLDGYLARRLEQHSPFGAFLDAVAVKLMVAAALVMLIADTKIHTLVNDSWLLGDNRFFGVVVLIIL